MGNYEKKLRLAKEALESGSYDIETIEYIFPELKENEDELTWLTRYIEEEAYSLSLDIRDDEDSIRLKKLQKAVAWLKKQGEKLQDKSEIERLRKAIDEEKADNSNKIKNTRPILSDFFNAEYERGKTDTLKCIKWSEEDMKRIQRISDFIWKNRKGDTDDIYQQEQDVKWLKSLKERLAQQK